MHRHIMAHASLLLPSPGSCCLPPLPSALRSTCSSSLTASPHLALYLSPPLQLRNKISVPSSHAVQRLSALPTAREQHGGTYRQSALVARSMASGASSMRGPGRWPAFAEQVESPLHGAGDGGVPAEQHYFATCHPGLEAVVAAELESPQIGARGVRLGKAGVHFRRAPLPVRCPRCFDVPPRAVMDDIPRAQNASGDELIQPSVDEHHEPSPCTATDLCLPVAAAQRWRPATGPTSGYDQPSGTPETN